MPKPLKQTPLARLRRERKALRAELDRVTDYVQQKVAEAVTEGLFDPVVSPMPGGPVLEARINASGEVVVLDPPPASPLRRRRK
jgi:hypothetical protein